MKTLRRGKKKIISVAKRPHIIPKLAFQFFWKLKLILILSLLLGGLVFAYFFVLKDIPSTTRIGRVDFPQSTFIYDRNDKLLYTIFASKNQSFVPLDQIPKQLQQATISLEDKDFYKHGAIDIRGIIRAFYFTIFKGRTQGGSTITQQLVKNSLLTPEQTISRKAKEVILSYIVESIYSKDKILEMYLNQVSYGGTAYGVQAASQAYFNKPVSKLSLEESAFLAALPEAPSLYSPFGSHPELGKKRQLVALRKMRELGYITEKEEQQAATKQLAFSAIRDKIEAPHFVFYVKDLLVQRYGQQRVERGGLHVRTSLDLEVQKMTEDIVASQVAKMEQYHISNAASLVTRPGTGEVLAMVGSKDYFDTENDGNVNVTLAHRQPGSSIKPIAYATGLSLGYSAATAFVDKDTCFPNFSGAPYCPKNYDGKFHGVVQMRYALANSYNIPAVKMLKAVGLERMIATASAMGITTFTDPSRYGLSLSLGGGEVTMLNMTEAFGVFANGGYRIPLQPILKVTDSKGRVIDHYKAPKSPILGEKVLPEGVAFIISHILSDNGARSAAFGSNSVLQIGKYPVSVKTGTTNDYRDNWTIGYTPSYVTAVWVGNNDNTPMSGVVSGVTGAAPIWNGIMKELVTKRPPEPPSKPTNVIGMQICSTSGLLPPPDGTPDRCPTRFEYFIKGSAPNKVDPGRSAVYIDKNTNDIAKKDQTDNVEARAEVIVTDPVGDQYCLTCPHPELSPTPTP